MAMSRDVEYAMALLWGIGRLTNKDALLKRIKFPSASTTPTEKEAMAALARVLMMDEPPRAVLAALANVFDPNAGLGSRRRRIIFQNLNQGHSDSLREVAVANLMGDFCKHMNYDDAAKEVTKLSGIGDRQVKRIYGKHKRLVSSEV